MKYLMAVTLAVGLLIAGCESRSKSTDPQTKVVSLEQRLAKAEEALEKLGKSLTLTAGSAEPATVTPGIRAGEFVLVDANGKPRALLSMTNGGPALVMYGENNSIRVALAMNKDDPSLKLYDASGKERASLNVEQGGPGLCMHDENQNARVKLSANKDETLLSMCDANNRTPLVWLSARKNGALMNLRAQNGDLRALLGSDGNGSILILCGANEKPRAVLDVNNEGTELRLFDTNGIVLTAMGGNLPTSQNIKKERKKARGGWFSWLWGDNPGVSSVKSPAAGRDSWPKFK